jgi:aryl-alcohol dehydrogenase-like predicted oxidoreductase
MRHIILGKSGLDVSRIAFGTWQLGGDWRPTDTVAWPMQGHENDRH